MRPRQFTDAELFSAAREVILAHGPSVSAKRIADELGVSAAALFKRVGTKQELIRRALVGDTPPFVANLEAGPDDRPVREQLLERAREIDDFFTKAMPAISMLKAAGFCPAEVFCDHDVPPPIRALRALQQWFEAVHAQGRLAFEDSEAIAIAFLGSLQARHAVRSFLPSYPSGGPRYIESLVDTTLNGIAPKESEA